MQSTITPVSTKGITISLLLIVLMLITIFMNIDPESGLQYIGLIIFVGGIIWSVVNYGKQLDHNATFGNYFVHGVKITALVTVIMIIFLAILILVFPDFKEKALDMARTNMDKNQNMTAEQKTQGLEMYSRMFMVITIGSTLLMYMIVGVIASLIGAAVTKKNPRPLMENDFSTIQ